MNPRLSSHIVIVCSYLHVPGGYEKAVVTTANLFAKKGHRVTLLVLDETAEVYYPVDPLVKIVQEPLHFGITDKGNSLRRKIWLSQHIRRLKKILSELSPTHIICSEYHFAVATIAARPGKSVRIYSWEHHHFGTVKMNRFWRFLSRRAYKKLDAIVCLNEDERKHYRSLNDRATVISNFIEPCHAPSVEKKWDLLSVTRFNHIKGIDLLMEVARTILRQHPAIHWKVIGYGEEQQTFLNFIQAEGFEDRLAFQPADKVNLDEDYASARLLAMTSRNECFPLVLLEAMCNSLPSIAFDCETGPRHIIRDNVTGLLVPPAGTDAMSAAIQDLLNDPERLSAMARASREIIPNYFPDAVYEKWKALFDSGDAVT